MNIVLLGSPASGKGTQAELITKKYNLYHLQTGELARKIAKKDPRINKIINEGKLIPEGEMTMFVIDLLEKKSPDLKNILFEGFPRFISQFEALDNFLRVKGDDIDIVISLEVSEEEAVKRITSRRICEKCGQVYNLITKPPPKSGCSCGGKLIQRDDDKESAVKVRFEHYIENTKKLIDFLAKEDKLTRINGERSIEDIFQDIDKKLSSLHH